MENGAHESSQQSPEPLSAWQNPMLRGTDTTLHQTSDFLHAKASLFSIL